MVILELICDMACPRHEWISVPGLSMNAHICARDASRVVIASAHVREFVIGAFSFIQGFRYEVTIETQVSRHTARSHMPARLGLIELARGPRETPKATVDSMTHVECFPDTEEAVDKSRAVALQLDAQTMNVTICVDFTDGNLISNSHFELTNAEGVRYKRASFHVNPPCVLYAGGASSGITTMRVSSVKISTGKG